MHLRTFICPRSVGKARPFLRGLARLSTSTMFRQGSRRLKPRFSCERQRRLFLVRAVDAHVGDDETAVTSSATATSIQRLLQEARGGRSQRISALIYFIARTRNVHFQLRSESSHLELERRVTTTSTEPGRTIAAASTRRRRFLCGTGVHRSGLQFP